MEGLFVLILVSYFFISFVSYVFLYKVRGSISYHFGMNLAMASSSVIGIAVGTVLGYSFPTYYTVITIVTTMIAVFIGAIFGALVDYQTLLSGVFGGIMAGIMGPMIGMAANFELIFFCTILFYATFGILCFTVRFKQ